MRKSYSVPSIQEHNFFATRIFFSRIFARLLLLFAGSCQIVSDSLARVELLFLPLELSDLMYSRTEYRRKLITETG